MSEINWKEKLKSRTVWIAIIAGVLGVLDAFGVPIPKEVYGILTGLGLYTARVVRAKF